MISTSLDCNTCCFSKWAANGFQRDRQLLIILHSAYPGLTRQAGKHQLCSQSCANPNKTQIILYLPHTQVPGARSGVEWGTPGEGRCRGVSEVLAGGGIAPTWCFLFAAGGFQRDPQQNGTQFFSELDIRKKATFLICPWPSDYRGICCRH